MSRFVLALLAACALCSGAVAKRANVGPVAVELPPPKGYCELDEALPTDRRLFDLTRTASPDTRLLAMSADCQQLRDWRAGRLAGLENYAQYQTVRAWESAPLPLPAAQLIEQTCTTLRAQGGEIASRSGTIVQERLTRALQEVKLNRVKFMGVLGQDPNACYAALLTRVKGENGREIEQATVFAVTIIRGKVVYYYLCARFAGGQTLTQMLSQLRVNVAALEAANR
jgi:hypothetical protein